MRPSAAGASCIAPPPPIRNRGIPLNLAPARGQTDRVRDHSLPHGGGTLSHYCQLGPTYRASESRRPASFSPFGSLKALRS